MDAVCVGGHAGDAQPVDMCVTMRTTVDDGNAVCVKVMQLLIDHYGAKHTPHVRLCLYHAEAESMHVFVTGSGWRAWKASQVVGSPMDRSNDRHLQAHVAERLKDGYQKLMKQVTAQPREGAVRWHHDVCFEDGSSYHWADEHK